MSSIKRPSLFLHLTDLPRALYERYFGARFLKSISPAISQRKDSVVVIPGLTASPWSTRILRKMLNLLGLRAHDWGCGRNLGNVKDINKVVDLVEDLYAQSQVPVGLIGWSLGGIYARRIAQLQPDKIKFVMTLGSPYRDIRAPNYASWFFKLMQTLRSSAFTPPTWVKDLEKPLDGIPTYAFYTKKDGIVAWEACMDADDPTDHQNIEVVSSHFGLGMNVQVLDKIRVLMKELYGENEMVVR